MIVLCFFFFVDRTFQAVLLFVEAEGVVIYQVTDADNPFALPLAVYVSQPVREPGVHCWAVCVWNDKNSHFNLRVSV